jgi:hypothetical protein
MDDAALEIGREGSTTAEDLALLARLIGEVRIAADGLRLVGTSLHLRRDDLHGDAVALTGTSLAALHGRLEETRRRLHFVASRDVGWRGA